MTTQSVLLSLFLGSPVFAASPYLDRYELPEESIIYQNHFDGENATLGDGWTIQQGEASIVQEGIDDSGAVRIAPSAEERFGQITFRLDPPPNAGTLFVDLMTKPVAFEEEPGEFIDASGSVTGAFRLVKESDSAKPKAALYVLNGNGLRGGDWIDTGVTFDLDEEGRPLHWMRLTFRQEFQRDDIEDSQNRWDLWVDEKLVSVDMGYYDNENVDPGRITLLGHRRIPLLMDALTVSSGNPLFEDANVNGLADRYESIFGLDRRDADLDEDGLTNAQEYLLTTNPTVADSDNDGLNDGDEIAADRDPRDAGDSTSEQAQGFSGGFATIEVQGGSCEGGFVNLFIQGAGSTLENYFHNAYRDDGTALPTYLYTYGQNAEYVTVSGLEPGISGTINIGVYVDNYYFDFGYFTFNCDECEDCASGSNCFDFAASSFDATFNLGKFDFGDTKGRLSVYSRDWDDKLYTRASVLFVGPHDEDKVGFSTQVHDGKEVQVVDWVRTGSQFVRLQDTDHGYQVEMFALENVDASNAVTGEPFQRVDVFDPAPHQVTSEKRIRIVESIGRSAAREFTFYRIGGQEIWEHREGSPDNFLAQPIRYEKVTIDGKYATSTYKGLPTYTKRKERGGWNAKLGKLSIDHVEEKTFKRYAYGRRLTKRVVDPDGQALTTTYGYQNLTRDQLVSMRDQRQPGMTATQWRQDPGGDWQWYGYDEQGRKNRIVRPIGNTPRPDALPEPGLGYAVEQRDFDGAGYDVRSVYTRNGKFQKATFTDRHVHPDTKVYTEIRVVAYKEGASMDDPDNDRTVKITGADGLVRRVENPDGTLVTHDYREEGDHRIQTTFAGQPDRRFGTLTTRVTHRSGTVIEEKTVDIESNIATTNWRVETMDERFRPTIITDDIAGQINRKGYDCCDVGWETRNDGLTNVYERDVLGRLIGATKGYKDPFEPGNTLTHQSSRQSYILNGIDQRLGTLTHPNNGSTPHESTTEYNLAAQQTAKTSAAGVREEYQTIMLPDGGRIELTSLPKSGHDNRHRITQRRYDADGTLRQTLTYASSEPFATKPDPRTQVANIRYTQGLDSKGRYKEEANIANIFDVRRTRTYLDEEGRQKEIIHAYGSRLAASEQFDYNKDGQLIRHINPDGVTTRFAYNEKGERTTTALDLNIQANEPADHIDYEVDRISVVVFRGEMLRVNGYR